MAGFALLVFAFSPFAVSAQSNSGSQAGGTEIQSLGGNLEQLGKAAQYDTSKNNITEFPKIVGLIISYFAQLLGVIYLGLVVYAGSLWMMAHGNDDQVVKAKTIIRNATIGMILFVGAYAIVYFVLAALSSGGFNSNLQGF
ncbi:hypothetical protein A2477_00220 [Candidatus Falkowbacteria bacterium RIFOXYC2_FULL_47_12]|uniref:DUF4190 domain-containing protein n=1 Tax=Candidatus Falkowbacteria bacterium RIFOXYC2_FULL_47_12 TaxID=1798004 RepID=A0A1F5TQH9_9BACT|nr:MAG: hypothetical protein A2477_00220 [Candidatus Falkowbacteria bacterium RIFOXYC2_FULL_47_12]